MSQPVLIAALLAALPMTVAGAPLPAPTTVIELFQSQGCSSCPPANANVNALIARRPDVLALSYSVTYWDQLGWKDGFAQAAFTQRQWDYAKTLHHNQVWTPQVVINGHTDIVGSNAKALDAALVALPGGAPVLAIAVDMVSVGRGNAPSGGASVWLVRYDPRIVEVAIKAGENNGRTLPHRNIVRALVRLGVWSGAPVTFDIKPAAPGLASAVLLQATNGPILAAARG